MTMIRAFARTRTLKGPARADVDLAMTKWWGKKRPAEGQVSGILSCQGIGRVFLPVRNKIISFKIARSIHQINTL